MSYSTETPPESDYELAILRRYIVDFWNGLGTCDFSGATTWDVLDEIRTQVSDLLYQEKSPDAVRKASRLTAKAVFLFENGDQL